MKHFARSIIAVFLSISFGATMAIAEPGISATKILIGQVAALEGPLAAVGHAARAGLLAAFNEVNAKGGVAGRHIELLWRDDSYEPEQSVVATRQLIAQDQVFALAGAVGTPTTLATAPIAQDAAVPFIGPLSGAEFLRDPAKTNVVNVRASYAEETEAMVDYLTKDRGMNRIGILYQDDPFGRAGLAGVTRALAKRGLKLVAEGPFERNTTAVKTAVATLRKADPQAVIMIAAYGPCAKFIELGAELNFKPLYLATSVTGLPQLAQELGPAANGIMFTQVMPLQEDGSLPVALRYRAALAAVDPQTSPGPMSFEGYIIGRLIIAALQASGPEPTRQAFLAAIFGHVFDFDGVVLDYRGPGNQAAPHVSLVVLDGEGKPKRIAASSHDARFADH